MILDHPTLLQVVRNTPLVAVDLVVRNAQDEVLLGWRTNEPARGTWFVPGGRICKNEPIARAFERISNNELGTELALADASFLGPHEHFYSQNFAQAPEIDTHYVVLAYTIRPQEPLANLPADQHSSYRWWTVPDLLQAPDVHPNTKAYFPAAG